MLEQPKHHQIGTDKSSFLAIDRCELCHAYRSVVCDCSYVEGKDAWFTSSRKIMIDHMYVEGLKLHALAYLVWGRLISQHSKGQAILMGRRTGGMSTSHGHSIVLTPRQNAAEKSLFVIFFFFQVDSRIWMQTCVPQFDWEQPYHVHVIHKKEQQSTSLLSGV